MSACYLTTQGRVLLAKMLASDRLIYTRAVTSSVTVEEPNKLTALPMPQQEAYFLSSEQIGEACHLTVSFNCSDLEQSYQLKMLGIYAKTEAENHEILYKVLVYTTDEERVTLPAGQDMTIKFVVTDAVTEGDLTVEVVDDLAAPIEHVYNSYRHLFTQTNNCSPAVVDCGERSTFADGQRIVFVPRVALAAGSAKISCAGKNFDLKCVDLADSNISYVFVPTQSYVLIYRESDNSFVYVKHDKVEYKDGVGHVWNGSGWQTIIEAGRIVSSIANAAPVGTLLCDGSSFERECYPELFAAIGTTFGAADDNHFNVPDLRGRCLIGSSSTYTLGSIGGEDKHQLSAGEMPKHLHSFSATTSSVSHNHTATATMTSAGAHDHNTSGTTASVSHSHTPSVSQTDAGGHTPTIKSATISVEGSHRHLNGIVDDTADLFNYGSQALSLANHKAVAADTDVMPRPQTGYTSIEGSHSHTASITLNKVDNHNHNVRVTIPSSGSHSHSFSATTNKNGSHTHPISVAISSKAHNHTVSGTTAIEGNNTPHNNLQPYMAINFFVYTGRPLL